MSEGDTGAMLEWVLAGAPGLREAPEDAPGDAALVAYLSGALAPAEAARVEQGLVDHRAARRRLPEVAARLEQLQAAPWPAAAPAGGIDLAWWRLAEAGLAAPAAVRDDWWAGGWEAVRAGVAAGLRESLPAWAAFGAFVDQWKRALAVPSLAAARGGGEATVALPDGIALDIVAEVTPEGDLAARASVRDAAGLPSSALDGRTVWLSLAAEGDAWPLASAPVRAGTVEWHLSDGGRALGLHRQPAPAHSRPLPAGGLTVMLAPPPPPGPDAVRALVAADGAGQGARVELWGRPRRAGRRLHLAVALPALTREVYADHHLCVSAAVTPEVRQWLGAWPVSEWGDAPRPLEAPCPGPDGDFDAALLCFDLLPRRGDRP